MNPVLWSPPDPASTNLARFIRGLPHAPHDLSYAALHQWSLEHPGPFWLDVWRFAEVIGDLGHGPAFVPGPHMTDTVWFPEARLNFAENLLHPARLVDDAFANSIALVYRTESGEERRLTRRQLHNHVVDFANFLRFRGVKAGDRVAAVVSNTPEAVIAALATAAIGAIWSSCSPDFGDDAICDRFGQIEPVMFLIQRQAEYAGKRLDLVARLDALRKRLPTVRWSVIFNNADGWPVAPEGTNIIQFRPVEDRTIRSFTFDRFPFAHPLAILYSSGTTGAPKCIIHGAGGTLLQHLKEHQLHSDLRPSDRLFYYTTTGWMMWNWLVSGLASRAALVLYDGSPFHPDGDVLWKLADEVGVTHFGTSAKYLAHLEKLGGKPRETHGLAPLRVVLSTGSPLLPESFDFVYRDIKADVQLASISGGTDIISCFALVCPTEPVRRGELQVKGLGMDVHVWDAEGKPLVGEPGELVCTSPFPSMPVGFWNDPDKAKYRASYFGIFDNVWCHGDWATETPTGGFIIHGRSDTTLNPGGVRIGTAEIYQQVEAFPDIAEALATALRRDGDEQIVLFVRLKPGKTLMTELTEAIRQRLRTRCSPRHVPAFVVEAPDFPRTISGKLSEVAVRNSLNGQPVKNTAALANPETLAFFAEVGRRI